jgi:membrane glycosyltransferase
MPPRPWFGFTRGVLQALVGGASQAPGPAAWQPAASNRRRALLMAVLLLSTVATTLLPSDEGPLTALRVLQVGLFALLFAWLAAGFITALMGFRVLLRGDRHALPLPETGTPIAGGARTAIIMPICNEDIATVFGGLRKTCESLAATGALRLFDVYVLSDTSDPALRGQELAAWQALRRTLGDSEGEGGRVFYRWRQRRTKRKSGNVADFCRRWGRNYRYMVVLDADSVMSGETLVSLVRMMEANPRAGILQTLPRTHGHHTLHARTQQFAASVTGRLFALGLAYWQLGESHYWGHNAILRVEPFMKHCGLAPIPGRGGLAGDILSHDFVEAALMRRAGYEVWLVPGLEGSWEQQPPNLIDELQRDRRWCQGNLQNSRLIAEPGWRPVHRMMFLTGALSYAVAPLWLAFVVIGVVHAATEPAAPALWLGLWSPSSAAWGVWALTLALLLMPRLLGVWAVRLRREQGLYGGARSLWASATAELLLSALQAPVRMLAHTVFVLSALTGLRLEWKSPPRDATSVSWRHALMRLGPSALPALAVALVGVYSDVGTLALAIPLLLAVPLAVLGSRAQASASGRLPRLLLTPQEHAVQVRHGWMRPATSRSVVHPRPAAVASRPVRVMPRPTAAWAPRLAAILSPAALAAALVLPQPLAIAPQPTSVGPEMDTRYMLSDAVAKPLVRVSAPQDIEAVRRRSLRS